MTDWNLFRACLLAILTGFPVAAPAYEVATHYNISLSSFLQSGLSTDATLTNLGLKPLGANQVFPTTPGTDSAKVINSFPWCQHSSNSVTNFITVDKLVACGAMFEDVPDQRSLNHFFNPTDSTKSLICFGASVAPHTSPEWALMAVNQVPDQQNSYANARAYFESALTTPDSESARDQAWGATFQSLGQVIHHLEDMAQPQHVRNDAHAPFLGPTSNANCFHESRFEKSTDTELRLASLALNAMYAQTVPVYPAYAGQLLAPLSFWTAGVAATETGTGIADYTNSNFVSAGTNFCGSGLAPTKNADFAHPVPIATQYPDISIWKLYMDMDGSLNGVSADVDSFCQTAGGSTRDAYLQNCYVTMVASNVHDPLSGAADVLNDRASTFSVFDEDLNTYNQGAQNVPGCSVTANLLTNKIFALNRFNFAATYPFLMSHAVAYSAGLINYFFRGQMQIAAPPEGVYGIVDTSNCFTSSSNCGTIPPATVANVGFAKIKLLLKNNTPNDDMGAGTLRAVAKYHLNKCFQPNLSGEYGGDPQVFTGDNCRLPEEYITVSNAVAIDPANGIGNGPTSGVGRNFDTQARVFTFPVPIPINASDLFLQVVFKGTLGQETNAIAVTTKDISEPNFFAIMNMTDYAFELNASPQRYASITDLGPGFLSYDFPSLTVAFGSNVATLGPASIATLADLGAGQHAQLALLMDRGDNAISVTWQHGWTADAWIPDPTPLAWGVDDFTMDDTGPYAGHYTRTCPVFFRRGVYRQSDYYFFYQETDRGTVKNALVSSAQVRPKANVLPDSDCEDQPTGFLDFSKMTPFNPAAALPWQINF